MNRKKKKSNRQKSWEYMRRNRLFRAGNILMILEVSESGLKTLIRELLQAGYIKKVKMKQSFADKTYRLVRDTGVICPSRVSGGLFDKNIKKFISLGVEREKDTETV